MKRGGFGSTLVSLVSLLLLPQSVIGQAATASSLDPSLIPSKIPRLALVIGAEHYHQDRGIDPVPNAINDSMKMRDALQQAGFSFVRLVIDPDNVNDIQDYVNELVVQSGRPEDPVVLVFFFAGHGFQNDAFNYIVPAGARADHPIEDSFPVINIVTALAAHRNSIAILLFDSCRTGVSETDPSVPGTLIERVGFSMIQTVRGADLGLATDYGKVAKSRVHQGDPDSPYTTALSEYMLHKSMSLALFFDSVDSTVSSLNIDQNPFEVKGAFDTGFFFIPGSQERDDERRIWQAVLQTNEPACVRAFLNSHPGGDYIKNAVNWLADPSHVDPTGAAQCPLP